MILLRLFFEFAKVGLFAVGGGLATIPFLQDMGTRTGWFTDVELTTMIAVSDSAAFKAMPLYPADGSVQVVDGRVVVKVQETYIPKSDFELAYENRR